jgi:hypothetical protein
LLRSGSMGGARCWRITREREDAGGLYNRRPRVVAFLTGEDLSDLNATAAQHERAYPSRLFMAQRR